MLYAKQIDKGERILQGAREAIKEDTNLGELELLGGIREPTGAERLPVTNRNTSGTQKLPHHHLDCSCVRRGHHCDLHWDSSHIHGRARDVACSHVTCSRGNSVTCRFSGNIRVRDGDVLCRGDPKEAYRFLKRVCSCCLQHLWM